ncbi:hypothetical protein OOK60_15510 [Trichothermofontia sichuanensis B231]|nr:hypothetical protein [Trichothermofontia sichuanensis]UZQ53880.1 hypothetical protein OOK60_15510 [Trichothermofontia sichuanensis B231]
MGNRTAAMLALATVTLVTWQDPLYSISAARLATWHTPLNLAFPWASC